MTSKRIFNKLSNLSRNLYLHSKEFPPSSLGVGGKFLFLRMQTDVFHYSHPFELESGSVLPEIQLSYAYAGTLNAERNNVIWVCHALTANAIVSEWWPNMVGPGKPFDTDKYFVICANMLGSCYGSTSALSINPQTGHPYYQDFPLLSNRDIVNAFDLLRIHLQIPKVFLLIGGSMGGQQTLEWAIKQPDVFEYLIPLATNARHSAWGIGFNESQRMAIEADSTWGNRSPVAGIKGLKAARAIALLSYRGYGTYVHTQTDSSDEKWDDLRASSYQQYQGEKLIKRFDAFAYWTLSKGMDSQHVGRGRGSIKDALGKIRAKTLILGVDTDVLFPVEEQHLLRDGIPGAKYAEIKSLFGHDGFLIETEQITTYILEFLYRSPIVKSS